jgi:hypothetical protein
MTVHARGYRPYEGRFGGAPAWWVIFRTGLKTTLAGRGIRLLGILLLLWFVILAVFLYIQIGAAQNAGQRIARGGFADFPDFSRTTLIHTLTAFYSGVTALVSLLAIFSGAGLVSEDLHARALTLYLVRPLRPVDYALGKALVVPWVLLTLTAIPGLAYWVLVGAWQAPGYAAEFWDRNLDVLGLVLRYTLVAAGAFTGLILLLSAGTPRRGVVSALAAAAIFGGSMLYGIGARVQGTAGDLMRLLSLPLNSIVTFVYANLDEGRPGWRSPEEWAEHVARVKSHLPDPDAAAVLAALLFVLGFARVWVRARSVEVTE